MNKRSPASGERNAIGGYLPQFDTFAWLTYQELIRDNFVWLRIADYKAEKLDDVQYSTKDEVHAYQIKWSNKDTPETFSFTGFKRILPDILKSWKALRIVHAGENKKIIAHLLTNRPLSKNDTIKNASGVKVGSCSDFYTKVWLNLKTGQKIESKWKFVETDLKKLLKLSNSEFEEFLDHFEFQPGYSKPTSNSSFLNTEKQRDDLKHFSRFIMDEVASKKKQIQFNLPELIKRLGGSWQLRFKTTFNHELVVDKRKYQPITQTLSELDDKISKLQGGYLFMVGGPGTGKSTLVTQWSKNRSERIIKYYAFDFTNPSSAENYSERGESVSLFFDLVLQIKEAGFYKENVLPYRDIVYLKNVFSTQIEQLGIDYSTNGRKTIIVIDGLDHIPREYKTTIHSFLADLPSPSSLPKGVYVLLGSQSYELENITQEIKSESQSSDRSITMSPLGRNEVFSFIDVSAIKSITVAQKEKLYEKSQGHPLYLSYIIERIKNNGKIDELLNSIEHIDGDIELYYRKIWQPISPNAGLIELLGLIARINDEIDPAFVSEWSFEKQVLIAFKNNAKLLFEQSDASWSFFHNSFRQFLITESSINPLTSSFDSNEDKDFHRKLASFYTKSKVEPAWKKFYHIYKSENFDEFIQEATPDEFVKQALDYRPTWEIRRDIQSGIEIAKRKKDVTLLVRYLFALTELDNRASNLDPAVLTKHFLSLEKGKIAKNYLRSRRALHCSSKFAFRMSRVFYRFNDKKEASLLFNLAIPDYINNKAIVVNEDHRYEEIKETSNEWIRTAPYFLSFQEIMLYFDNINFTLEQNKNLPFSESKEDFKLSLITSLAFSLIKLRQWGNFENLLKKFNRKDKKAYNRLFEVLYEAIEECLNIHDIEKANWWLSQLLKIFPKDKIKDTGRIYAADLIYKVTGDLKTVRVWIAKSEAPIIAKDGNIGYEGSLSPFYPLIKLNKLRHVCGKGVSIVKAVPAAQTADDVILVEFQRMLCLITKILSDGLSKSKEKENLIKRIEPIVRFYYKDYTMRERNWYQLKQMKGEYYEFLIYAVSTLNKDAVKQTGDYLLNEFINHPNYWPAEAKRIVLDSLLTQGYDANTIKICLKELEQNMLIDKDVSGRVDECIAQLKLSLKLSETKYAEKMIKKTIQESFGVGYRKDYQFNSWIEWIEQVNEVDKNNAGDRLKWVLARLRHIEQTTEGRAYWEACDSILNATFKWDFSAGTQQLKWQLDNEHIGFEDAITIFTEFYLARCESSEEFYEIFQFYTECLIIFSEHPSSNLLSSLLEKGIKLLKEGFQDIFLPQVINAVMTRAVEERRFYLLKQTRDFCDANSLIITKIYPGFTLPPDPKENDRNSGANELVLENKPERLVENDVLSRITTFEDLEELVKREGPHSYFDWSKSIDKISDILTEDQIKTLADLGKTKSKESKFIVSLSQSAFKNGYTDLAKELGDKAVQLSNSHGWNSFYDGGTRLHAFLNLKAMVPKEAADKAFEVFAHDITNGGYSYSLSLELEKILPALTETVNVKEIWPEISGYLDRLMANSVPDKNVLTFEPGEKSLKENFVDLLFYFFRLSSNPLKDKACKLIVTSIIQGNAYTQEKVADFFTEGEHEKEIFIDILLMLQILDYDNLLVYQDQLTQLASSENYYLRYHARDILQSLKLPLPEIVKRNLPGIYNLHLSIPEIPFFERIYDGISPEVNLNDPTDIIRPFDIWIEILAEESGFDFVNLAYRIQQIMKEIDSEDNWTRDYEESIRKHLDVIRLKHSYTRPRVVAVKRAIMHLVAELIDSNSISQEKIEQIRIFKGRDFELFFLSEIPKPDFIPKINNESDRRLDQQWVRRGAEHTRLNEGLLKFDGKWIVGEHTIVVNLNDRAAKEIYCEDLDFEVNPNHGDDDVYNFFEPIINCSIKDYHECRRSKESLIIEQRKPLDFSSVKINWIAINPGLARKLKWEKDDTRLFAWKNAKGNLMAESVYWASGDANMHSNHRNSEAGEGWIVLLTDKGMEQIKGLKQTMKINKLLKRIKGAEDMGPSNIITKTVKFKG